jgi:hypothetical protein
MLNQNKKIFPILLVFLLVLVPIVSASYGSNYYVSAGEAGEFIGYAKQGNCFTLKQSCADCTYVNISAVIDSSGNTTTNNTAMQKTGGFYNYSQCGNLVNGRVDVIGIFNPDGINQTFNYYYEVNPTGSYFGIEQSSIFILFIGIFLLFGFILGGVGLGYDKKILIFAAIAFLSAGLMISSSPTNFMNKFVTDVLSIINYGVAFLCLALGIYAWLPED